MKYHHFNHFHDIPHVLPMKFHEKSPHVWARSAKSPLLSVSKAFFSASSLAKTWQAMGVVRRAIGGNMGEHGEIMEKIIWKSCKNTGTMMETNNEI
jgi:hypothetical protein